MKNYLEGKSHKAYKVHTDLEKAAEESPQLLESVVCTTCAPTLSQVAKGFIG